MSFAHSRFIFTTCQVGAEITLKEEIARIHPHLHASYSRPGFVTFKRVDSQEIASDFELGSIFARAYGLSMKKIDAKSHSLDLHSRAAAVIDFVLSLQSTSESRPFFLQVWERDQWAPGEAPRDFVSGQWAQQTRQAILHEEAARGISVFRQGAPTTSGERVIDVVCVEEAEWWIGLHEHSIDHSPYSGGVPPMALPEEAPSRAYLKLEEGVLWSGAPLRKGDLAVEIGSAPGGASYALLKRGLSVVGIDPAEMDPRILKMKGFTHIQKPIASVLREDLPETVHWLLLDMNVTPYVTLFQVDRLATRLRDSLLGVLLTIKLNEWRIAREIPSMFDHLRAMGMVRIRARQLASNKQEIFIFALTRKGAARLGSGSK